MFDIDFLFLQKQFIIEILILFLGLLFTGIPHGAIDHLVAKKPLVIGRPLNPFISNTVPEPAGGILNG